MTNTQYYKNLIERVIKLSESDVWEVAVREWHIYDCELDETQSETCVCGKEYLKQLFTIKNEKNGIKREFLFPQQTKSAKTHFI